MEKYDTIDYYILAALFLPVPIKDKAASQTPPAKPLFHFSLKCKPFIFVGENLPLTTLLWQQLENRAE